MTSRKTVRTYSGSEHTGAYAPLGLQGAFRDILQKSVKDGLSKNVDDIQRNGAMQIQGGWMHIHGAFATPSCPHVAINTFTDSRNLPPLGRIGNPDDIIGTVLVEDSKVKIKHQTFLSNLNTSQILPETYQPMPAYRLCTADGPPSLTPGLAQHLLAALNRLESSQ
jgi:hypothetical protein